MTILIKTDDTHILVQINANFDAHLASEARTLFEELIKHADRNIILDLSQVERIDSSGIGAIVFLFKRLHVMGFNLTLRDLQEQPFHVIEQLHINDIIKTLPGPSGIVTESALPSGKAEIKNT